MRFVFAVFIMGLSLVSFAVDYSNPVFPSPGSPVFGPPPGSFPGGGFAADSGCTLAEINNPGQPAGIWLEINAVAEGLKLDLKACNFTDQDLTLNFPSGQSYDLVIHDRDGQVIWRWSWGMVFVQVLTQMTLAPGQEVLWGSGIWPGELVDFSTGLTSPAPRGAYIVVGEIPATNLQLTSLCHIVTLPYSPFGFANPPGGNGFPCDPTAGLGGNVSTSPPVNFSPAIPGLPANFPN